MRTFWERNLCLFPHTFAFNSNTKQETGFPIISRHHFCVRNVCKSSAQHPFLKKPFGDAKNLWKANATKAGCQSHLALLLPILAIVVNVIIQKAMDSICCERNAEGRSCLLAFALMADEGADPFLSFLSAPFHHPRPAHCPKPNSIPPFLPAVDAGLEHKQCGKGGGLCIAQVGGWMNGGKEILPIPYDFSSVILSMLFRYQLWIRCKTLIRFLWSAHFGLA